MLAPCYFTGAEKGTGIEFSTSFWRLSAMPAFWREIFFLKACGEFCKRRQLQRSLKMLYEARLINAVEHRDGTTELILSK
ncbi:MAG: hypothetical protein AAB869_03370, partial [Patescibacteria group bacterium]